MVDKWTLEELITEVGDIDRSAAFKALVTWVNMGVLKEDPENAFVLLRTCLVRDHLKNGVFLWVCFGYLFIGRLC